MAQAVVRGPAPRLFILTLCCLLSGTATVAAQDWNPFARDERRARPATPVDPGGLRPGDRPLEPGGRGDADERSERSPAYRDPPPASGSGDRWAPPAPPRGAAPVAVERGELAPVEVSPERPDPRSDPRTDPRPDLRSDPRSDPRYDPRSAPAPRAAGREPMPRWDTGIVTPAPRSEPPGWVPNPQYDRGSDPRAMRPPAAAPPRGGGPVHRAPPPAARTNLDRLAAIDAKQLEDIVLGLELPSKSPTIAALWPQIWAEAGGSVSPAFEGIRLEALSRAGAVDALRDVLGRTRQPAEPVLAIVVMRARLLVGDREGGCTLAGEAIRSRAKLPASFRRDAVLAAGYCAIVGGNAEAAKLTADLIRGERIDAPFALAVLEGAGAGGKAAPALAKQVDALDYRIGEAAGLVWPSELADRATPGLLAVLSTAPMLDPGLRVVVAERAARLGLLAPDALAEQYRAIPHPAGELAHPLATSQTDAMRRSLLLQAAEQTQEPERKARVIAALMDDAGRSGFRAVIAQMLGPVVERLRPSPQVAWLGETAAEILVMSGRGETAHAWIDAARGNGEAWRLFAALARADAAPLRGELAHVERLALAGKLEAPLMHRLVTVLDALDIQIPIPLWEAASRTPQPTDGHLPATGVLAELKAARDQRDGARTILRAAEALGPASPAEVNLLALGDVIRALKGVGFEREARAVGIEALAAAWPRGGR